MTSEKVSVEEAVKRMAECNINNTRQIIKLENQVEELCKNFTEYREQNSASSKKHEQTVANQIESIQLQNVEHHNDNKTKWEESRQLQTTKD
jgi:hypothetical protein